jgi:hypothetical protein
MRDGAFSVPRRQARGHPSVFSWLAVLCLGGIVVISWSLGPPPALASICRAEGSHTLCLASVKRSAKYPWEYRVMVTVNGIPQAPQRYNCRDRVKVNAQGYLEPFKPGGLAQRLCQKFSSVSTPGTSRLGG